MTENAEALEKLVAALRPVRQARWEELHKRVTDKDPTCGRCLEFYKGACQGAFSPSCFMTTDLQIREQLTGVQGVGQEEINEWWV